MNPDENWKETRLTAKDLSVLLGVSVSTVEEFLVVVENLLIHKLVETLSEVDDIGNTDVCIELPYLGSLVISTDKRKVSTNFVVRPSLYRKIKKACSSLESPLTEQLSTILGECLLKKYEEGEIGE